MDRARVICPSLSLAVHFTGAALLATVPLFLPDRLPSTPSRFLPPPSIDRLLAVSLGVRPAGGGAAVRPARSVPAPRPVDASRLLHFAALPELPDTIDLGQGIGVPGLPDGLGDDLGAGTGLCLSDCDASGGSGAAVAEPPSHTRGPIRAQPGGLVHPPVKVHHVAPIYPPLAISAQVQGDVFLDCVIDASGTITSVNVLRANPLLAQAAVEAVQQWRYRPTLLNGSPVSVLLAVTVEFRLR